MSVIVIGALDVSWGTEPKLGNIEGFALSCGVVSVKYRVGSELNGASYVSTPGLAAGLTELVGGYSLTRMW